MELLAGAISVFCASFLGGVTGFGYSLVATPLLLLAGFSLPFVVTVNLSLACLTRISVAYRLRAHLGRRRVAAMIAGSVPGLWLGAVVLSTVPEATIKVAAGIITMLAAVALARSLSAPPPPPVPGASLAAGFAGGFLGASTSLNGIAPVLLLARDKTAPRTFQANLAYYFVVSNALGLLLLTAEGAFETEALYPAFVAWLPGSIAGNWIGTVLGPRLPERTFRVLTLVLVFIAGGVTALSA